MMTMRLFWTILPVLAIWCLACNDSDGGRPDAGEDGWVDGDNDPRDGSDGGEHPVLSKLGELVYGEIQDFEIVGDLLVAVNYFGLVIYDISEREDPELLSRTATSGEAWRVAVAGRHAYVADGRGGLLIVDIDNPRSPVVAGEATIPGEVLDVAVRSGYAVVASLQTDARVFDITSPEFPVEAVSLGHRAADVTFQDDGHLITFGPSSNENVWVLRVFDFSDPLAPAEIGSLRLDRYWKTPQVHEVPCEASWGFAGSGRFVFLGDLRYGEIQMVDVGDREHPSEWAVFVTSGRHIHGLQDDNGRLFAAVGDSSFLDRVLVFEVGSFPEPNEHGRIVPLPEPTGRIEIPDTYYLKEIAAKGSLAVVVGNKTNLDGSPMELKVIGFNDRTAPVELGMIDLEARRHITGIGFDGSHALLATSGHYEPWAGGVTIADVSDPSNLVIKGSFPTDDLVHDVVIDGARAYAVGQKEFSVSDITSLPNPSIAGVLGYPELNGRRIAVYDDHAFVVVGDTRRSLKIIDVSDPGEPGEVGELSLDGQAPKGSGIAAGDGLIAVANGTGGLLLFDAGDPSNPEKVGSFPATRDFAMDVALGGHFAFLAAGVGVHVLDVRDPGHPTELLFMDTPGYANRVVFVDNVLLVGDTHDLCAYAFEPHIED